jgi:UDPglucose 6-dehydrogenase
MKAVTSISILGCGTVGTTIGKGFLKLEHEVIFYDIDKQRIKELHRNGFNATLRIGDAVKISQISFICVPTPTKEGRIDLSYVKAVVKSLAKCLKEKSDYHLVVIKSTVTPTTSERVIIPLLAKHSGKKIGIHIGLCANPEFMTEKHRSWTRNDSFARSFFNEPVIVIGELDKKSGDCLQGLYQPLKRPIIRTNLRTAEMIKYAFNCALATKISYWNEIYYICRLLEINSDLVASAAAMDERIGKYGTIHGKAFGGECLPKDLRAFIQFLDALRYEPKLLKAVEDINMRIKADRGVRE